MLLPLLSVHRQRLGRRDARAQPRRQEGVDPARRVGAIVCFNVASPYHGQGLARQLLDAACEGLRADGFAVVESYPAKRALSDVCDYHGRLDMYLKAGFTVHRESEHFAIVRKAL